MIKLIYIHQGVKTCTGQPSHWGLAPDGRSKHYYSLDSGGELLVLRHKQKQDLAVDVRPKWVSLSEYLQMKPMPHCLDGAQIVEIDARDQSPLLFFDFDTDGPGALLCATADPDLIDFVTAAASGAIAFSMPINTRCAAPPFAF